jgi:hypothetical protein
MSLQGLKLTQGPEVEILSAYAASHQEIAAVAATPGWYVIGVFYMIATSAVRLEIVGSVTHDSLTMKARLFDVGAAEVVSGCAVELTGPVTNRRLSAPFSLPGAKLYQIQVEVTGSSGADRFGVLSTASLVNGE